MSCCRSLVNHSPVDFLYCTIHVTVDRREPGTVTRVRMYGAFPVRSSLMYAVYELHVQLYRYCCSGWSRAPILTQHRVRLAPASARLLVMQSVIA